LRSRRTRENLAKRIPPLPRSSPNDADADNSEQASVLHHKVRSGETLYSIATTYKTTVAALKRNNGTLPFSVLA
jgi:LysM repeat protein